MRNLQRICAIVLGSVLFIAGLLKMMDPVGSSLIMEAYFKFLHLAFLRPGAWLFAEGFALFETVLGAALICGVWKKTVARISAAVLVFFTMLTLVLWISKAEMDCGCFGQAIHLKHNQSFFKNVGLCALWALAFLPGSGIEARKSKYAAFGIASISALAFLIYSALSIPMMDFTEYKSGEELNLSFYNADWEYGDSLACKDRVMISSVYDAEAFTGKRKDKVMAFADSARAHGFKHLTLIAAAPDSTSNDVWFADRKTLMTLNRSNGGASLISDGQIIAKWSYHGLPSGEKLEELENTATSELLVKENAPRRLWLQGFLLYVFSVMLLL